MKYLIANSSCFCNVLLRNIWKALLLWYKKKKLINLLFPYFVSVYPRKEVYFVFCVSNYLLDQLSYTHLEIFLLFSVGNLLW